MFQILTHTEGQYIKQFAINRTLGGQVTPRVGWLLNGRGHRIWIISNGIPTVRNRAAKGGKCGRFEGFGDFLMVSGKYAMMFCMSDRLFGWRTCSGG